MSTRVMVFEDKDDLREGLSYLLKNTPDIEFTAAFANCDLAVEHVETFQPDVVLMDIEMPGTNGMEGLKQIKRNAPDVHVLMLTVFDDNENIFNAICLGASGYLLKSTSPATIVEGITDVMGGGAPMTSSVAKKVLQFFPQARKIIPDAEVLTPREEDILNLLVKGFSYKMIAAELTITIHTVRSHIRHIYDKMHVNSATEAVSKTLQHRLS